MFEDKPVALQGVSFFVSISFPARRISLNLIERLNFIQKDDHI